MTGPLKRERLKPASGAPESIHNSGAEGTGMQLRPSGTLEKAGLRKLDMPSYRTQRESETGVGEPGWGATRGKHSGQVPGPTLSATLLPLGQGLEG